MNLKHKTWKGKLEKRSSKNETGKQNSIRSVYWPWLKNMDQIAKLEKRYSKTGTQKTKLQKRNSKNETRETKLKTRNPKNENGENGS